MARICLQVRHCSGQGFNLCEICHIYEEKKNNVVSWIQRIGFLCIMCLLKTRFFTILDIYIYADLRHKWGNFRPQ